MNMRRMWFPAMLVAASLATGCATGTNEVDIPEATGPASQPLGHAIRLYRSGNTKKAVEPFTAWLAAHPRDVLAHYYLAEAYVDLENYDQAAVHFRAALEPPEPLAAGTSTAHQAPSNPVAARHLIGLLAERIETDLVQAPESDPDRRNMQWRLLAQGTALQARYGDRAAARALEFSNQAMNLTRWSADSVARTHVRWNPLGPELLARGAAIYATLGDETNTRRLYQAAYDLMVSGRDPNVLGTLSHIRAEAGDFAGALAWARSGGPHVRGMRTMRPYFENQIRVILARRLGEASSFLAAGEAIQKMNGPDALPLRDHTWSHLAERGVRSGGLGTAYNAAMAIENAGVRLSVLVMVATEAVAADNSTLAEHSLQQAFTAYRAVHDPRRREAVLHRLPEAATGDTAAALARLKRGSIRFAAATPTIVMPDTVPGRSPSTGPVTDFRHPVVNAPPAATRLRELRTELDQARRHGERRQLNNLARQLAQLGDIEGMEIAFREAGRLDLSESSMWLATAWTLAGETGPRPR